MEKHSLLHDIQQDIADFYRNGLKEVLFNERDFQMHLALFLKETRHYDDVDLEYYVPHKEIKGYVWENEIRMDIVIIRDQEYLPIELKYKTKEAKKSLLRFNENLTDVEVLKNQGAKDLGMYDFWKDIRRIELIRRRFTNVKNGLAIFMTNEEGYLKDARSTSNYINFCMQEGVHTSKKNWINENAAITKGHPSFEVEKEYNIHWNKITIEEIPFYYCVTEI